MSPGELGGGGGPRERASGDCRALLSSPDNRDGRGWIWWWKEATKVPWSETQRHRPRGPRGPCSVGMLSKGRGQQLPLTSHPPPFRAGREQRTGSGSAEAGEGRPLPVVPLALLHARQSDLTKLHGLSWRKPGGPQGPGGPTLKGSGSEETHQERQCWPEAPTHPRSRLRT